MGGKYAPRTCPVCGWHRRPLRCWFPARIELRCRRCDWPIEIRHKQGGKVRIERIDDPEVVAFERREWRIMTALQRWHEERERKRRARERRRRRQASRS